MSSLSRSWLPYADNAITAAAEEQSRLIAVCDGLHGVLPTTQSSHRRCAAESKNYYLIQVREADQLISCAIKMNFLQNLSKDN